MGSDMALSALFPALVWMRRYRRADLPGDLLAGLTTAIMLVPQAMAYALLAGLPPQVGLYAAVVPPAIYALFGRSPHLAVGPVAMDSLLVAVAVGAIASSGTDEYLAIAVLLALMTGLIQVLMGLFRLGFLTNFLSAPVISGFTSAAAFLIGLTQIPAVLGVAPVKGGFFEQLLALAGQLDQTRPAALIVGLASVGVLVALKRWVPKVPRALVVVVGGTAAVTLLGLAAEVPIVGPVPAGLPPPTVPELRPDLWATLLPSAFAIALVGFMEAISVAKALALRSGIKVFPNQELVAIGAANLGGSFFSAFPVTGGFSRSAVQEQAGARTPLAGLVTAAVVLLALSLLTPWFHDLPKGALAAIILTAVASLVDVREPLRLWRVHRPDFFLLLLTFLATLGFGILHGLAAGVLASMAWFVYRSTRPHFAVLGWLPGTSAFRNVQHHPGAKTWPGVLLVRFDSQFYFGNVSFLEATLERLEAEAADPVRSVVLDFAAVNGLDASADAALFRLVDSYRERGISVRIAQAKRPVLEVMERSGLAASLGPDAQHLTLADAVADLLADDALSSGQRKASS